MRVRSSADCSCCSKWLLVILLECISRQKGSSPILASRFCTTSSAAIFSATNRTRRPWKSAFEIMLVMVWLLPVPGGPWRMKLRPSPDSMTASNCER